MPQYHPRRFTHHRRKKRTSFRHRVQRVVYARKKKVVEGQSYGIKNVNRGTDITYALHGFSLDGISSDILHTAVGTTSDTRLQEYVHTKGYQLKGVIQTPTTDPTYSSFPGYKPQNERLIVMGVLYPWINDTTTNTPELQTQPHKVFNTTANQFPSEYSIREDVSPTVGQRVKYFFRKSIRLTAINADPANISSDGTRFNLWIPFNMNQWYSPIADDMAMNKLVIYMWVENGRATNTAAATLWHVKVTATKYYRDAAV